MLRSPECEWTIVYWIADKFPLRNRQAVGAQCAGEVCSYSACHYYSGPHSWTYVLRSWISRYNKTLNTRPVTECSKLHAESHMAEEYPEP